MVGGDSDGALGEAGEGGGGGVGGGSRGEVGGVSFQRSPGLCLHLPALIEGAETAERAT